MIPTTNSKEYRQWFEEIQMYLMKHQGVMYALVAHQIFIEMTDELLLRRFVAAIQTKETGETVLYLCVPAMKKLSAGASAELLKHEILHLVYGHTSSRRDELVVQYGPKIFNIAADLVINQQCDEALLAKEGHPGVTIADFGFSPNLTTEMYCRLLQDRGIKEDVFYEFAITSGNSEGLAGKRFEVILDSATPPEVRDAMIEKILMTVREEARRRGLENEGGAGRGFFGSEAEEFIEQLKRKPQVPWNKELRNLEESCYRHERVPTVTRPSRRHPAHFGRIRKGGLFCWFCVDTSGSMGEDQLKLVNPELQGMANRGAVIKVLHCDAEIAKEEDYNHRTGLARFTGRGGTDFSPIFIKLAMTPRRERPGLIVFYTDGYGGLEEYKEHLQTHAMPWNLLEKHYSDRTPEGVPLLWILAPHTATPAALRQIAPFGKITVLPGGDDE